MTVKNLLKSKCIRSTIYYTQHEYVLLFRKMNIKSVPIQYEIDIWRDDTGESLLGCIYLDNKGNVA